MRFAMKSVAAVALALGGASPAAAVMARANPIRKVVTMLEDMQKKVIAEGKKEQDSYDKFMCYCSKNRGALEESIEAAKAKIESFGAEVQAKIERKAQLEAELTADKASKVAAEQAVETAKALREKEAKEYAKTSADLTTNIQALQKAVAAIEKGTGGAFLQTPAAGIVRTFAVERSSMSDDAREELMAFLSEGSSSENSGEIIGILKQLGDEMQKDLEEATAAESAAQANFEELVAAKQKEISMLQQQIEDKMERVGQLGVEVAEAENDLENTKETLAEDEKFKAELDQGCSTKTAEWEAIKKTRSEEIVAISETIKILNDDDALDLFKKALPSSGESFMQLQVTAASAKARALLKIRAAAQRVNRPELDLLALAMQGKKVGFEKVLGMIDEMVENLKTEQKDDDSKREYCNAKLDEAEDKQKELKLAADDTDTAISAMKGDIESLSAEIEALKAGIVALDKSVAQATEDRKQANVEYKELMAQDNMAKEVLGWAKNRLNKFYNPKLYVAPAKAAEGEASASLSQLRRAAPPPPPETFGAYTKKGEESNGVLAMIDTLIKDLDKEITEAEVMEKDAQSDYEKLMADAGEKRAADAKALTEKEGAIAGMQAALEEAHAKKEDLGKELMGNAEYTASLHAECDWLLKYYDTRKEARTTEMESLSDAKAVLNGADFSLVQTQRSSRRLRLRSARA